MFDFDRETAPRRYVRRVPLVACRVAALALALAGFTPSFAQSTDPGVELDSIVAEVGDDVITRSELDARLAAVRAQLQQSGYASPSAGKIERQVLERLVLEHLQLQVARRTGVRISDDDLNRAVANLAKKNQLSLGEFRDVLERDGYDFAKFRERIRNQMLIARVQRREVENRIRVSQRDIDNFLATTAKQGIGGPEYHLRQILVGLPEAASPEQIAAARSKALALLKKLRGGADFAQTAAANSDGQQALKGGELGWFKTADLPTLFAPVVPKLKPGQLSEPIRSLSGFHIVKLEGLRDAEHHFVTQTHARHILIRTNELIDDKEARARLAQLRLRIEGGDDFAELARGHSDDPGSAAKGGDLGWLNPGDVVPEFQRVMDKLKPGEISEPFKSPFGWHLLQVLARRQHDDTEQARRGAARAKIRKRKLDEALQEWLRRLREEAYVQYHLNE